jgi:predicted phosphodiesterase
MEIGKKINDLILANDTHYFGPHNIGQPYDLYEYDVDYLLGDIVDVHLAKKSEVNEAKILRSKLVTDFQDRYISGNHSLTYWNMFKKIVIDDVKILLTHGDAVFKDKNYALDYRAKKAGSNSIIRFGAKVVDYYRMNMRDTKLKTDVCIRAANLAAEYDCDMIITGHSHRTVMCHERFLGVDFYVLPRGIHHVSVQDGKLLYLEGVVNYEL